MVGVFLELADCPAHRQRRCGVSTSISRSSRARRAKQSSCVTGRSTQFRSAKVCPSERAASLINSELWLLPFDDSLSASFSDKEKREWCDTMIARGIRITLPVETYLQTSSEEGEPALPDDEPLVEDELRFLSDRKALLPY